MPAQAVESFSGFNRLWSKPPGRELVLVGEVMHLSHCFPCVQHAQNALQAKKKKNKQTLKTNSKQKVLQHIPAIILLVSTALKCSQGG